MSGVPPAKRDLAVVEGHQSAVGDGDAVSVGAEIPDHVLRSAERAFAIDHPVVAKELPDPGGKRLRVSQELQLAMEAEFASAVGAPEGGDKLSTKDSAQHLHREEERVARFDPAS